MPPPGLSLSTQDEAAFLELHYEALLGLWSLGTVDWVCRWLGPDVRSNFCLFQESLAAHFVGSWCPCTGCPQEDRSSILAVSCPLSAWG